MCGSVIFSSYVLILHVSFLSPDQLVADTLEVASVCPPFVSVLTKYMKLVFKKLLKMGDVLLLQFCRKPRLGIA